MSDDTIDMFSAAYARHTDPQTSHAAAQSLDEETVTRMELKALEALQAIGGEGIADEIVAASNISWRSLTPRFRPLKEKGCIRVTGQRKAESGRQQDVLALTPRGIRMIKESPNDN